MLVPCLFSSVQQHALGMFSTACTRCYGECHILLRTWLLWATVICQGTAVMLVHQPTRAQQVGLAAAAAAVIIVGVSSMWGGDTTLWRYGRHSWAGQYCGVIQTTYCFYQSLSVPTTGAYVLAPFQGSHMLQRKAPRLVEHVQHAGPLTSRVLLHAVSLGCMVLPSNTVESQQTTTKVERSRCDCGCGSWLLLLL